MKYEFVDVDVDVDVDVHETKKREVARYFACVVEEQH